MKVTFRIQIKKQPDRPIRFESTLDRGTCGNEFGIHVLSLSKWFVELLSESRLVHYITDVLFLTDGTRSFGSVPRADRPQIYPGHRTTDDLVSLLDQSPCPPCPLRLELLQGVIHP